VDIAFFAANVIKIPEGGWFPIVMGLISFTVLTTWRRGRKLVRASSPAGHPDVGLPAGDRQRHPPGQRHRGVHDEFEGRRAGRCCTTSSTTRSCTSGWRW
jgi:hypothetical protein